jgi:hypothetical protein
VFSHLAAEIIFTGNRIQDRFFELVAFVSASSPEQATLILARSFIESSFRVTEIFFARGRA